MTSRPPQNPTPEYSKALAALQQARTVAELIAILDTSRHPSTETYDWIQAAKQQAANLTFDGSLDELGKAMAGQRAIGRTDWSESHVIALTLKAARSRASRIKPTTPQPPLITSSARFNLPCQNCGNMGSDPEAVFCSRCGERIVSEDTEAMTRTIINMIETRVPTLVSQEVKRQMSRNTGNEFSWMKLPNPEKWKVTWGVIGRSILIQIGIWVAVVLLALAIGLTVS